MKLYPIISVALVAIIAIGTLEALPYINADLEPIKLLEPVTNEHVLTKRTPERVVINYKPPPPNGPRHARSASADVVVEGVGG